MLCIGHQLRAARALLGLDQIDVARLAAINPNTVRHMESTGSAAIAGRAIHVQKVQRVLEAAGVEFVDDGRPGVRLTKLRSTSD